MRVLTLIIAGKGIDTINAGDGTDTITGGAGNDIIITGGKGDDIITGGAGNDTFNVDAGSDTITDLSASDIFVVSNGATLNATISANYTATTDAKNDGTANLTLGTVCGLTVDLTSAAGANGFNLIGSSGTDTIQLLKADTFTIASSGQGNLDVLDGAGVVQIPYNYRRCACFCG